MDAESDSNECGSETTDGRLRDRQHRVEGAGPESESSDGHWAKLIEAGPAALEALWLRDDVADAAAAISAGVDSELEKLREEWERAKRRGPNAVAELWRSTGPGRMMTVTEEMIHRVQGLEAEGEAVGVKLGMILRMLASVEGPEMSASFRLVADEATPPDLQEPGIAGDGSSSESRGNLPGRFLERTAEYACRAALVELAERFEVGAGGAYVYSAMMALLENDKACESDGECGRVVGDGGGLSAAEVSREVLSVREALSRELPKSKVSTGDAFRLEESALSEVRSLSKLVASGDGDDAEDAFNALKRIAISATRVLNQSAKHRDRIADAEVRDRVKRSINEQVEWPVVARRWVGRTAGEVLAELDDLGVGAEFEKFYTPKPGSGGEGPRFARWLFFEVQKEWRKLQKGMLPDDLVGCQSIESYKREQLAGDNARLVRGEVAEPKKRKTEDQRAARYVVSVEGGVREAWMEFQELLYSLEPPSLSTVAGWVEACVAWLEWHLKRTPGESFRWPDFVLKRNPKGTDRSHLSKLRSELGSRLKTVFKNPGLKVE